MVSFQRMRDEIDNFEAQVANKLPVLGRGRWAAIVTFGLLVLFVVGVAIGYGVHRRASSSGSDQLPVPSYIFVSNNSQSCPPLVGERLLTSVGHGQSFEGLVVNLACKGNFLVFPNQVKCRRRDPFNSNSVLEWSHLPVCYPSMLVSKSHWEVTLHARSVSCTGDSASTECKLSCIRDYIPVESERYRCARPPCPSWTLSDAKCFMCDKKCGEMHDVANPKAEALVDSLSCSCEAVVVSSSGKAAIWQNKRTGLFGFSGEHNGRPVYQNSATREFLFYTLTGSQWLVGPDFRKPHAGIQVLGNDDTQCPENYGGKNVSKLYIDSSEPSPGGTGKWTSDETLSFTCMSDEQHKPVSCECDRYKIFHTVYDGSSAPGAVDYMTGEFENIDNKGIGLIAPLYFNREKDLYLFSHHPKGLVWQVSTKLSTTPMRGVLSDTLDEACPDNKKLSWEWFNTTTSEGQQIYVKDSHIHVRCLNFK